MSMTMADRVVAVDTNYNLHTVSSKCFREVFHHSAADKPIKLLHYRVDTERKSAGGDNTMCMLRRSRW